MGIKQTISKAALSKAMDYISGDPEKNLPKLLSLIESLGWEKSQTDVFRRIIEDPDSVWYRFLIDLWHEVDNEILKTAFINFGVNAAFFGIREQRRNG
ncbi:MAG: hypothetical protein ACI4LA_02175 [Emergencia sp.]